MRNTLNREEKDFLDYIGLNDKTEPAKSLRQIVRDVWIPEGDGFEWFLLLSTPVHIFILLGLIILELGWLDEVFSEQSAVALVRGVTVAIVIFWFLSGFKFLQLAMDQMKEMRLSHLGMRGAYRTSGFRATRILAFLTVFGLCMENGDYLLGCIFSAALGMIVLAESILKKAIVDHLAEELIRLRERRADRKEKNGTP